MKNLQFWRLSPPPADDAGLDATLSSRRTFTAIWARLAEKPRKDDLERQWIVERPRVAWRLVKRALAQAASLRFKPMRQVTIITDKARQIYLSPWGDRLVAMMVAQSISQRLEPRLSDNVYSFRKGRGAHLALNRAQDYLRGVAGKPLFALKRDISAYGDSIPQDLLFKALDRDFGGPSSQIARVLIKTAIRTEYSLADAPATTACLARGIPSGSPLVPPLENFYLMPLDRAMAQVQPGFYGRYGDDFLFLTTDPAAAARAVAVIDQTVKDLGLVIKPQKAENRVFSPRGQAWPGFTEARGITWLGRRLNDDGTLGCKPAHLKSIQSTLRSELRRCLTLAAAEAETPAERLALLRPMAAAVLSDAKVCTRLHAHLHMAASPQLLRLIDTNIRRHLAADLTTQWGMGRRQAWQTVRKLKLPSLYFQYWMKPFARKAEAA